MGLLSKALETGKSDGGLLKRALELRGRAERPISRREQADDRPATAAGKSRERAGGGRESVARIQNAVTKSPVAAGRPRRTPPDSAEEAVRAILSGIQDLPGGLQAPAQLFGLLAENLDLKRAAILLPDYDDGTFVPWASLGFDTTTLQRMRMAKDDIATLGERGPAGVVWEGIEIKRFAPYFSHREATMLEQLLILPFTSGEQTHAVILIAESPYLTGRQEILRIVLAAVAQAAATLVSEQRHERARVLGHAVTFKRDEIGVVVDRVTSRTGEAPTILLIELSDVVSQITTANQHSDSFRVWQDVLRAMATLFASTASVCDAGSNRVLALIHSSTSDDFSLMAQQIAATLWSFFPELGGTTPPRIEVEQPAKAEQTAEAAFALL